MKHIYLQYDRFINSTDSEVESCLFGFTFDTRVIPQLALNNVHS